VDEKTVPYAVVAETTGQTAWAALSTSGLRSLGLPAEVRDKTNTSAVPPVLIEADEQRLADEALAPANPPPCEHDERNAHSARAPPTRLGVRLLPKTEILDITGVSFPTIWAWMRAGRFPRSRVAGGKSVWRSDEVDAWLGALPVRKLKGDVP
jgi:predicted DNA-binding transcriptional regulator AlpA